MKERPILFSGEMVRAILAGRKTQTRRVVKPQPSDTFLASDVGMYHPTFIDKDGEQYPGPVRFGAADENEDFPFPYGIIGSHLWVRETWKPHCEGEISPEFPLGTCIKYRADGTCIKPENWTTEQGQWCEAQEESKNWKPSIFMPRYASRITLEIVAVRVERLQEINEADARAEGVEPGILCNDGMLATPMDAEEESRATCRDSYEFLWDCINGAGSWALNPWVWVIELKTLNQTPANE